MKVELIHIGGEHSVDITVVEQETIAEYNPLQNTTMSVKQALELYDQIGTALNLRGETQ